MIRTVSRNIMFSKHPIAKAIRKKYGFESVYNTQTLIYASKSDSDYGWSLDGVFLGFTVNESIKNIENDNGR